MGDVVYLYAICAGIGVIAIVYARVVIPLLEAFGINPPFVRAFYGKPQSQTAQTAQTDRPDSPSDAPHWLQMDGSDIRPLNIPPGSRALLIEALVVAGWSVGQIRAAIKGDNNVISEEVAAARAKHDIRGRTITVTESGKAREIEL